MSYWIQGSWTDKSSPTITIESLKSENEKLIEEFCDLKKIIEMFTEGKQNFEYMLSKQRSVFNK